MEGIHISRASLHDLLTDAHIALVEHRAGCAGGGCGADEEGEARMTLDTSAQAVERRARELDDYGDNGCAADAALLRALLAERDALYTDALCTGDAHRLAIAERDDARAVVERTRSAWLRVIQAENTCGVTGKPCDAVRCGCAAEQEMLIMEADEARVALAGEDQNND